MLKKFGKYLYKFKLNIFTLFSFAVILFLTDVSYAEVSFKEPQPSSDWRYGDIVECSITVDGYESNKDTVTYRLANKTDNIEFEGSWQDNATNEGETFSVKIDSTTYKRFYPGDENKIQWLWEDGDDSSNEVLSDPYRIRVYEQDIVVIQPKPDTYSSTDPVFEFNVTEEMEEDNLESVTLEITGSQLIETFNYPGDNNFNFDSLSGNLTYRNGEEFLESGKDYHFTVKLNDDRYIDTAQKSQVPFSTGGEIITDFVNYPNPFDNRKEEAKFRYVIKENADVTINIYDTTRNLIKTVIKNKPRDAGLNEDIWNGKAFNGNYVSNGIYYAEIIAEGDKKSRRYSSVAVLVK